MSPRTTAILLVVAAALGSFVWFYELEGAEGRREAEEREKRLFADVESEAIQWIALETEDGQSARAERREEGWRIVEPVDFPADVFTVDAVASALAEVTSESVYEEPQDLAVYGLAEGSRELRFGTGDGEWLLRLGNDTPMGSQAYVWVEGGDAVYTISRSRVNALRKTLDQLREKRLLRFDAATVRGVTAEWPDGRVVLARDGEQWRLTSPLEAPADAAAIRELLSNLAFLRAEGFEDDPRPDAEAGLEPPAWRVRLELDPEEEGAAPRQLQLAIGSVVEDGQRLVRTDAAPLMRIAEARLDDFPARVVAYRDRELADFDASSARRIDLVLRGEDGETLELTALRGEEGWRSSPEEMAPEKIARLVDELSRLSAEDVLAERVGPEELAELGLDPPRASFAVREGDADDAALLSELRLGVVQGSEGVVAQSGERPQVYRLGLGVGEHLPINLEAFRNRFAGVDEPTEPGDAGGEIDLEALLGEPPPTP